MEFIKSEPEELWRDVVGFEGLYEVSNLGRIKRLPIKRKRKRTISSLVECIIKPINKPERFLSVDLDRDLKTYRRFIHKLVATAFVGQCRLVRHKNGDKTDNRLDNLIYVLPADDIKVAKINPTAFKPKYLIKCTDLNIETAGIPSMMKELSNLGYTNLNESCISKCIHGKGKSHKGLHFTGTSI